MPTGPQVLADSLVRRFIRKEIGNDVRAHHTHGLARSAFCFAPEATGVNRYGIDIEHGCGGYRPQRDSVGFLVASLDRHGVIRRHAGTPAHITQAKDRLRIVFGNILSLIELDEVFARSDYSRTLRHSEDC